MAPSPVPSPTITRGTPLTIAGELWSELGAGGGVAGVDWSSGNWFSGGNFHSTLSAAKRKRFER